MAPILYHSAYKVESAWEAFIDAGGGGSAIVEVQDWYLCLSLDVIGRACFSHDFGSLDGKKNAINSVLQTFSSISKDHTSFILLLQRFPFLLTVPTPRNGLAMDLHRATAEIADSLLAKIKKEKEEGHLEGKEQSSLSFLLVKSEDAQNNVYLTRAEVLAQVREPGISPGQSVAVTMTWALLELARNPDIQKKLRSELLSFGVEPTYDELSKNLPYLDAVVHEILRLHPAVPELTRQLKEDDIIPLSGPVRTKTGETVNDIILARGNVVVIPIPSVNRSEAIWGFDAKVFKPERWLDAEGVTQNAYEVPGHRHLLTFGEGTKHCLGKYFAIAEIKIVLSVLVKNFVLEMRDGPGTKIEMGLGMLPRPKLAGEDSIKMPLRVRRYEG
ncbi:hypothetical protein ID866_8551 [Astraeus odoratus]|nr:hypothetical protein ID866_8551 [Astraeus odoratus]